MVRTAEDLIAAAIDSALAAMAAAARTAPKGRGVDKLTIIALAGPELETLAAEMSRIGGAPGTAFFARDAACLRASRSLLLIGLDGAGRGVSACGFCGFADCAAMRAAGAVCAHGLADLGIAVGSAAALAADLRVDTRVMYSAGKAALALGLLPGCTAAYGLPLSASGKSPYFDRG